MSRSSGAFRHSIRDLLPENTTHVRPSRNSCRRNEIFSQPWKPFIAAVLFTLSGLAQGQVIDRDSFERLSEALAFDSGRTYEMGRRCNVVLEGLSRRATALLLGKYMNERTLNEMLPYFDAGVNIAARQNCDLRWLEGQLPIIDKGVARYMELGRPFRRF